MQFTHDPGKTHASFDDPNLVSRAGLVPVMALAERAGLAAIVREHVSVGGPCGVNADLKVGCLVAGMATGADSIEDMDVLRHGAIADLFDRQPQPVAARFRYHAEQCREQGPVRPVQVRAARLMVLQDGELVAQDQDLGGLPFLLAPGQPQRHG